MPDTATSEDLFSRVEAAIRAGGAPEALELLAVEFRRRGQYPALYELRTLQKRIELGFPLVPTGDPRAGNPEAGKAYDEACIAAAREVGGLFLADGDLARAWPYFRAIGETEPVAASLDALQPAEGDESVDALIEIAFQEGVHPQRGMELILAHHGICRAITSVEYLPSRQFRPGAIRLLIRTLYNELRERLRRTIEETEGPLPERELSIPRLIEGREWLFGEYAYYIDTSHVISVIQYSIELDDPASLELAWEIAQYGRHLSPQFHHRSEPPFDDFYVDYARYLDCLLGRDAEGGVAHFRAKAERAESEQWGWGSAEVFVGLLARLGRYEEAIEASQRYLADVPAQDLACPSLLQLCQSAGAFERMGEIARGKGDVINYAAALIGGRDGG